MFDESIEITTWSRGFNKHQGFREYLITCGSETVVKGSSVWVFFDFKNKRIAKVPERFHDIYEFEEECHFAQSINHWKYPGLIEAGDKTDISLRYSDFDTNGHVNNTVYLGFLETLFHEVHKGKDERIQNLKIRFCREIGKDQNEIQVGWKKKDGLFLYNVHREKTLFADGELSLMQQ